MSKILKDKLVDAMCVEFNVWSKDFNTAIVNISFTSIEDYIKDKTKLVKSDIDPLWYAINRPIVNYFCTWSSELTDKVTDTIENELLLILK